MTSSINLKKLVSVGAALLLAVGGSLTASSQANAAAATSAPTISGSALTGSSITATPAVWGSGTATGKWYVCGHGGSMLAATSVPSGCEALYTSRLDTTPITTTTLTVPTISYCAISCTSFGNSSIGADLRWIEQNGADISASAAVTVYEGKGMMLDSVAANDTSINLSVSGGCSFQSPSIPVSSDWSVSVAGTSRTISNIASTNNKITLSVGSMSSGQSISVTYTKSSGSLIVCGVTGAVANLPSALTATVGGGGGGGGTPTCAGQTAVTAYSASTTTLSPGGSFTVSYNGNPSLSGCILPTNGFASGRYLNGTLVGVFYYSATSQGLQVTPYVTTFANLQTQTGRTLVDGDVYTNKIWVNPGNTAPVQSGPGDFSFTITITGVGVGGSSTVPALTPEQAKNQIKPLPVIVQPLVAALPSLSKPLVDAGGKVDVKSGDFTGLVSASISGKALDLTVGSTGSLTITVPNGLAGTTADLLLNFKSGTVILQDAIKYVAPVVVAQVPVRPVSIKAGAKKLSATAADEIRHAAFANLKNNSIECVAYAASAATADSAKATAQQACDLAVKSNPDLVNTSVVVVIDKIKAATQGVGIRVYKQ